MSYGPARMGFGLFVPDLRTAFEMSDAAVGFVSSLGFLGFFLGLLAAQWLLQRRGPEAPVLAGLAAAAAGLGICAAAPSLPVLAAGVCLAASSAGFAWTPFNDAVHRKVSAPDRPGALSLVSTGTAIGIVLAGLAALVTALSGLSWRLVWAGFALAALAALLANRAALHPVGKSADDPPPRGYRTLLRAEAVPLFVIAFVYGVTSATFISFAADRFAGTPQDGGGGLVRPALVYVSYGLCGLTGLATARIKAALGLAMLIRVLMAAGALSLALAALLPGSLAALAASSGLQGLHVMMTSAVLAFWSERLFPSLPALSFTATLLMTAAGSVLGPALAGVLAQSAGPRAMFVAAALLPAVTALALRGRQVRERAPDDAAPA
ncbi:MFS transporter [Roseivivax sp. CAU 1761]